MNKLPYSSTNFLICFLITALTVTIGSCVNRNSQQSASGPVSKKDNLETSFISPPAESRPCVFWDWMGGMISKEGITKDLEAMAAQGIGGVMIMQMPEQAPYPHRWRFREYPGKVKVLSEEWYGLVNFAIGEADRLGLTFSMFISPGWSHAGGPWVTPEKSLKKLLSSKTSLKGPSQFNGALPRAPRNNGFRHIVPTWYKGDTSLPQVEFYRDLAVVAFPAVKKGQVVEKDKMIELTTKMSAEGTLSWQVPEGEWTVMRLGIGSENGVNHPAPLEATGPESDRMDPEAVNLVFDSMIGRILKEARAKGYKSFKAFETDSYEAGFQDFGLDFQEQFLKRRGYDCIPWLPSWLDKELTIENKDLTDRFRYDMRVTISELMAERFHGQLRTLADKHNVEWMTEPYFGLSLDWRTLGSKSNLPGAEFWVGAGFSVLGPAPDIAALYDIPIVWAESFTAGPYTSAWRNDPALLKPWGDEAFCRGLNQFYLHGFVHNPFGDHLQPGLTMSPWGTQLSRHVTWWPFSGDWHRYLARCQYLLRQGDPVNDVLVYPSGFDHVAMDAVDAGPFRQVVLNDEALMERISVNTDGKIVVKGGGEFVALALTPDMAMRPKYLRRVMDLMKDGATIIGLRPPSVSPSLERYPACDEEMKSMVQDLWDKPATGQFGEVQFGDGRLLVTDKLAEVLNQLAGGPDLQFYDEGGKGDMRLEGIKEVYYSIFATATLKKPSVQTNANTSDALNDLDYVHRRDQDTDIYFVSNIGDQHIETVADFRVSGRLPEIWNPSTGEIQGVKGWRQENGRTKVVLSFFPNQSLFVVFRKPADVESSGTLDSDQRPVREMATLQGSWSVGFDTTWGGPESVVFSDLIDWSEHPDKRIKYFSGTAVYEKSFVLKELPRTDSGKIFLTLGKVNSLARVVLNGQNLGVAWCVPWRLEIPAGLLKAENNRLRIEVANSWVNRLVGDEQESEDSELIDYNRDDTPEKFDMRALKDIPDWVINNEQRPSADRYTFTTWRYYGKKSKPEPAGLLGPVKIVLDHK